MNSSPASRLASATKSKASTASATISQANRRARSSGSDSLGMTRSGDFANGAHEFAEVFAVARSMIQRVESGVRSCFGQNNPTWLRLVFKDNLVPLNRRNLIIKARNRTAAEKRPRGFGRI